MGTSQPSEKHVFPERVEAFTFLGSDPDRIALLKRLNFRGNLADYAQERALYGDSIDPIHLFVIPDGNTAHNVAWVHRSTFDLVEGEVEERYQIACDCTPEAESSGEPDAVFACSTLVNSLFIRAGQIRHNLSLVSDETKRRAIVRLLKRDKRRPETWPANVEHGEHAISLLSVILMEDRPVVQGYADYLAAQGRIEFEDDETVRLTPRDMAA